MTSESSPGLNVRELELLARRCRGALDWYAAVRADRPLAPDQLAWCLACEAAVDDALAGRRLGTEQAYIGGRQVGKNEADAEWSVRALFKYGLWGAGEGATLIKSAPTYKPQIIISMRRLERVLRRLNAVMHGWQRRHGYIYEYHRAAMVFLTAHESGNRVGDTASLCLTVDEAQLTSKAVYDQDFSPMRAAMGVPAFFQGTAWKRNSLLEQQRERLKWLERKQGRRLLFVVPWHVRAETNERYGQFVEQVELPRLGATSMVFRTQYLCEPCDDESRMFTAADLAAMRGDFPRLFKPRPGEIYVGAVDFSGATESQTTGDVWDPRRKLRRDSLWAGIGRVQTTATRTPEGEEELRITLELVHMLARPGLHPTRGVGELIQLFRLYRIAAGVGDANGVGDLPCAQLAREFGESTFEALKPTQRSNDEMGHLLQTAGKTGRLQVFQHPDGQAEMNEFWEQIEHVEIEVGEGGLMRWEAPRERVMTASGQAIQVHDDAPKMLGMLMRAAYAYLQPVRPPKPRSPYKPWDEETGGRG